MDRLPSLRVGKRRTRGRGVKKTDAETRGRGDAERKSTMGDRE